MRSTAFLVLGILALVNARVGAADPEPIVAQVAEDWTYEGDSVGGMGGTPPCCGPFHHRGCCCRRDYVRPFGQLHQHYPYQAEPKTYYYFRPYNHMHVFRQQQEAIQFGADPRLPYSNALFKEVYAEME